MKLPTPAGYVGEQRKKRLGSVQAVSFSHSRGSLIILERGDEYDGIVDFGWQDRDRPLVFEKPYIYLDIRPLEGKGRTVKNRDRLLFL